MHRAGLYFMKTRTFQKLNFNRIYNCYEDDIQPKKKSFKWIKFSQAKSSQNKSKNYWVISIIDDNFCSIYYTANNLSLEVTLKTVFNFLNSAIYREREDTWSQFFLLLAESVINIMYRLASI